MRPVGRIASELATLNRNFERYLWKEGIPEWAEISKSLDAAPLSGRLYVGEARSDEELADAEWRELHNLPKE